MVLIYVFYLLAEIANRTFYLPFLLALKSESFKLSFNVDFCSLLSLCENRHLRRTGGNGKGKGNGKERLLQSSKSPKLFEFISVAFKINYVL